MAKKKNRKNKKEKRLPKNKKMVAKGKTTSSRKAAKGRKSVRNKKIINDASRLEKREIWKKNLILAVVVMILFTVNVGIYYARTRNAKIAQKSEIATQKKTAPAKSQTEKEKANNNENQTLGEKTGENDNLSLESAEDEKNDKIIQELIKESGTEYWKTYRNSAYGFEIKYPPNWPSPAVSGPQKGYKFKYKVAFRENGNSLEEPSNGLDVYVYRSSQPNSKLLKADYTDNLVIKNTAEPDFGNCKELEVFSIGAAEYPTVQVYTLQNDPCFNEAYFFSLRKGFYIYDIVPILKNGINYNGYDGEKMVGANFLDFYRILATLNFPAVKQTVTNPAVNNTTEAPPKPKVEAPRVVKGIRCPEKIQHPKKSPNKGKHVDEDCCPDPDEWPKAGCAYSAHDFSIMLKGKRK